MTYNCETNLQEACLFKISIIGYSQHIIISACSSILLLIVIIISVVLLQRVRIRRQIESRCRERLEMDRVLDIADSNGKNAVIWESAPSRPIPNCNCASGTGQEKFFSEMSTFRSARL